MTPEDRSARELREELEAQRQRDARRAALTPEQIRQRDDLLASLDEQTRSLPSEFDAAIGVVRDHLGGTIVADEKEES